MGLRVLYVNAKLDSPESDAKVKELDFLRRFLDYDACAPGTCRTFTLGNPLESF